MLLKKTWIISILLLMASSIFASENIECISMGTHCSAAAAIQAYDLRKAAYPFDWMISDFHHLYATLQDDFRDFLNPSYLHVRNDNHGIINKYGLVFVHDFPTIHYSGNNIQNEDNIGESILHPEWITFLPEIQTKYDRRINRFRERCSGNKKIYFIRHFGSSRGEAIRLRDLIQQMYPALDFTLVIVGNNQNYSALWGEKNIRNYYLNDSVAVE